MSTLYEKFKKIDIRAGTIIKVETFPEARKPAYKIWVDFGPDIGVKQTSAQVTVHYTPESLIGARVMGCLNLGSKEIGGFTSEFLLTGCADEEGAIHLTTISPDVPNGAKLF